MINGLTIHDVTKHSVVYKEVSGIVKAMGYSPSNNTYKLLQSREYNSVKQRIKAMELLRCVWGCSIVCFQIEPKIFLVATEE